MEYMEAQLSGWELYLEGWVVVEEENVHDSVEVKVVGDNENDDGNVDGGADDDGNDDNDDNADDGDDVV